MKNHYATLDLIIPFRYIAMIEVGDVSIAIYFSGCTNTAYLYDKDGDMQMFIADYTEWLREN